MNRDLNSKIRKAEAQRPGCGGAVDRPRFRRAAFNFGFRLAVLWLGMWLCSGACAADPFADGVAAYRNGEFAQAAEHFRAAAERAPAAGAFVNLGLAEWERGRRGHAVLAWERALWLQPSHPLARENLAFARGELQLEAPAQAWHEVASTWLPVNAWAWLAGVSLWLAVSMMTVPGWLRRPRRGWHQAVAAAALAVFLMAVPAMLGVQSRARTGIVLERNTPLRLTPTAEAQPVTLLTAGDPVRIERARGNYLLVQSSRGRGWLERSELGRLGG